MPLAVNYSNAFDWGQTNWAKLGSCAVFPSACPLVYAEEVAQLLEDAKNALEINLGLAEKQACGNLGDKLEESTATNLFIPDYFPPDENATQTFIDMLVQFGTGVPGFTQALDACMVEGTARLYHACEEHDYCMENRTRYSGTNAIGTSLAVGRTNAEALTRNTRPAARPA